MIGKLLKGLFGSGDGSGKKGSSRPAELYEGYEIIAEPRPAGGQWQVAGRIEKDAGEERKVHVFVRADTMPSEDEAATHMVRKAKVMIDQQGDSIFT
ncbi:HlyU family transcriptional regulator [Roseibium sediminis]|uniref:HlyU family transcriptional regulator n=1 Tax=Roseibium sediminis TaxID=1775174 RepID=UPI00123D5C02|nr:HlyU family transcriptional regulator [Roseibium sediminis]